jgi:serine/threonine protein kinase
VTTVRIDARYRLVNLLSTDHREEVWGAHDERLNRRVAVHLLPASDAPIRQFQSHVSTLAQLSHPALVRLYDANPHPVFDGDEATATLTRRPMMVTELLAGPTVARSLEATPLSVPFVTSMAADLASVVAYLHDHGIANIGIDLHTIMICATTAFEVTEGQLGPDGRPVAKLGPSCIASLPTSDAAGPATDIYALGRVLSEAMGPRQLSPNWVELLERMLDPHPQCRPTAPELCRLIADLDSEYDEILPWQQEVTDELPPRPRGAHRARVRLGSAA